MPEFINSKRGYKVANCWLAGEMQRERERERSIIWNSSGILLDFVWWRHGSRHPRGIFTRAITNVESVVGFDRRSNIADQNHYGKLRTESRQCAASRVIPMDRFRSLSVSRSLLCRRKRTKKKKEEREKNRFARFPITRIASSRRWWCVSII